MIRFAQTCGPVMAKSKEDTAFYRWNRFVAVNEVGSEPTIVGISQDAFHDFCRQISAAWPSTMTTLSTHDTKRSEDVRARLSAMLEHARDWESCLGELRAATEEARSPLVDGATELLLWQTLLATWRLPGTLAGAEPISHERLAGYLTKAMREAKSHTTWTAPDAAYEEAVIALADSALADERVAAALDSFVELTYESLRAGVLGSKLIQLTMPGVPDVYQGAPTAVTLLVGVIGLAFAAHRNASPTPWTLERVYALFPRLGERSRNLGNRLSGGEQQMLAIGRALMTNPHLLILDEATEGLAPLIREEIWRCLAALRAEGQTILVIDKYVKRLVALADRHTIIERGQVVWQGDSASLEAQPELWQRYIGI